MRWPLAGICGAGMKISKAALPINKQSSYVILTPSELMCMFVMIYLFSFTRQYILTIQREPYNIAFIYSDSIL